MAAARALAGELEIVDLRKLRAPRLGPLLEEQSQVWMSRHRWDFEPSAAVIRRFLDSRGLLGYALACHDRIVGYSYFVVEDNKALFGDLFISRAFHDAASESRLFRKTIEGAALYPGIKRVEGQLLAVERSLRDCWVFQRPIEVYPRLFMVRDRLAELRIAPNSCQGVRFTPWTDRHLDASAELIEQAYRGHIDSHINDQYRSFQGARRFIANTTEHPGCGEFSYGASVACELERSTRLGAVCLGSRVGPASGHITQLCAHPQLRRRGLGQETLRRSLGGFRRLGCNSVSLTVTASNESAIELYNRFGFTIERRFEAFVWQAD